MHSLPCRMAYPQLPSLACILFAPSRCLPQAHVQTFQEPTLPCTRLPFCADVYILAKGLLSQSVGCKCERGHHVSCCKCGRAAGVGLQAGNHSRGSRLSGSWERRQAESGDSDHKGRAIAARCMPGQGGSCCQRDAKAAGLGAPQPPAQFRQAEQTSRRGAAGSAGLARSQRGPSGLSRWAAGSARSALLAILIGSKPTLLPLLLAVLGQLQ